MSLTYSKQDTELLNRIFQIPDPAGLSGLLDIPPTNLEGFQVEYEYDLTPKDVPAHLRSRETMLSCIHCHKTHNHWKGLVFKHHDGRRMLIGKDCGRLHYGEDYEVIKRGFDRQRERKFDLQIIYYAYPRLLQLSEALAATADHISYVQLDEAQVSLKSNMPVIFRNLTSAARGERGMVIMHKRIHDDAAMTERKRHNEYVRGELAAMTRSKRKHLEANNELPKLIDESKPIWKIVVSGSFQLRGNSLFLEEIEKHREAIRGSGRMAKALYEGLQNRDSASLQSGSLMREIAALGRLHKQAQAAMEKISTMSQFFEQSHLAQIATWASGYDGDGAEYKARPRGLIRMGGPNTAEVGLPSGFKFPDDSFIRNFGMEVSGSIKTLAA